MQNKLSIGKLNLNKLNGYFEVITDEIIITDERINHILEEHKEDFEKYFNYIRSVIENPNYILKDYKNDNTVMFIRKIENTNLNVIIRLAIKFDEKHNKNSVITMYRIRDKNLVKLIHRNECIYKVE